MGMERGFQNLGTLRAGYLEGPPNLTVTLGFRWDDQGNPYSRTDSTVFGNFYLGPGQTSRSKSRTASRRQPNTLLNHTVKNHS